LNAAKIEGGAFNFTISFHIIILPKRTTTTTTLASKLATNDSVTISFLVTQGSTAYYMTALTIDGNAQTVKYSGGTAPAAGNASSVDIYSFTIVKTAANPTYTVFGAGPVKYA
jgi:hypothetical protein